MNLGYLAQALLPGIAGHDRGQIAAEETGYRRQRQQREDALNEQLRQLQIQNAQNQLDAFPAEQQQRELVNRARALSLLPDMATAPASLPYQGPNPMDQAKLASERALAEQRLAEARLNQARRGQLTQQAVGGGQAKTWRQTLEYAARTVGGDLFQLHHIVNADPELRALRANGTITDYDVEAAAAKGRQGRAGLEELNARTANIEAQTAKLSGAGAGAAAPTVPPRLMKRPDEDLESYAHRLRDMGVTQDQAYTIMQQQGLSPEAGQ